MRSAGGERVARQFDPTQRCEPLHEFIHRRENCGGLEDRTLGIVSALLVPARDLAEHLGGGALHIRLRGDDRVAGQVIEQRRGRVEEQRQVVLDARRRRALGDVAIDRHARQIAGETIAEAPFEILDAVGGQWEFTRRQQSQGLHFLARALRLRIEHANGFDLVIEQVDAIRRRAAHRVQVDDRAAYRELAGRHDLRTRDVAGAAQAVTEGTDVEHFANAEIERVPVDVGLRRQALQRCLEIDDDDTLREPR
jgi:hypothetical protein